MLWPNPTKPAPTTRPKPIGTLPVGFIRPRGRPMVGDTSFLDLIRRVRAGEADAARVRSTLGDLDAVTAGLQQSRELRAQLHVSADDHYPVALESYLGTSQRGATVAHSRGLLPACYLPVVWLRHRTGMIIRQFRMIE